MNKDIVWHTGNIQRKDRNHQNHHQSAALWFTGLPSSGKSTLAHALEQALHLRGYRSYVLDGDNIRHGLSGDLQFSKAERTENIRRISEVAKLFVDAGLIVICAFISPYQQDRRTARALLGKDFIEVYCQCSLEACEQRDPKGLYKKARANKITDFTGISSPYEPPEQAEITLNTETLEIEAATADILVYLEQAGILPDKKK